MGLVELSGMVTLLSAIPISQLETAILNGEIKLEPKLGNEDYQTWSEAMELLLAWNFV